MKKFFAYIGICLILSGVFVPFYFVNAQTGTPTQAQIDAFTNAKLTPEQTAKYDAYITIPGNQGKFSEALQFAQSNTAIDPTESKN